MNILVILSDQQHKEALGKVNPTYITPNLDALATEGILFKNAYSPNPVCGPYRGCLMTGQYTSRCKVLLNEESIADDATSLAEVAKNAGYNTSYVGKYHLGDAGNIPIKADQRRGFDKFLGYQCYNGFEPQAPYNNNVWFFDENDEVHKFDKHRTDVTTDLTIASINELAKDDKPFFMMTSYQAPHYPVQPSEKYAKMYEKTVFEMPDDYIETRPYTKTWSPRSSADLSLCPDYQRYGEDMQEYMRLYAAMCTQIDAGVGKIIQTLKELGIYDDTYIVYTADHGDMQGSRGLLNKCVAYERSAGVPMIMKYPNGRTETITDELVSGLDIYKTVMGITGGTSKNQLDGTNLVDFLSKKSDKTQDFVISEHCMNEYQWRMIRDNTYKLITDPEYNPTALYNMNIDPFEQENLVSSQELANKKEELVAILKDNTLELR